MLCESCSQFDLLPLKNLWAQLAVSLELDTVARFESEIGEMQRQSREEVASLTGAAVAMEAELSEKVAEAEARAQRANASVESEAVTAVALRAELAVLGTAMEGARFEQDALQQLLSVAMDRANTEADNASRAEKRTATLDRELGATRLRMTALQSDAARVQVSASRLALTYISSESFSQ